MTTETVEGVEAELLDRYEETLRLLSAGRLAQPRTVNNLRQTHRKARRTRIGSVTTPERAPMTTEPEPVVGSKITATTVLRTYGHHKTPPLYRIEIVKVTGRAIADDRFWHVVGRRVYKDRIGITLGDYYVRGH